MFRRKRGSSPKKSSVEDAVDRTFEGSIGPLFIHEKTLSDAEVLQNYNALKPRFT